MPVKFGLIGFPLSHSFSQQYFTKKFAELGLTGYVYRLYELPDVRALPALLGSEPDLRGLNVTIPHKITVMPLLHEISPEAAAVGAVNTIRIGSNGSLAGFNTDVYGFEMSIKPFLENFHQRALVLGNGGAARAVKYVLKKIGIDFATVTRNGTGDLTYDQLNEYVLRHHLFVINTTPVGMSPAISDVLPFPFEHIGEKHFCVDLIYNPAETVFLQRCRQQGAKTLNGLNMLHLQAEKAFEIWQS
jgi:shikimate dehydrogenase